MDLFLREAADRIGDDDMLAKIDALLDWRSLSPILKRGLGRGLARDLRDMIRWFCLSVFSSVSGMDYLTQSWNAL